MKEIKNEPNVINIDIVSIIKEAKSEEKSKIETFIAGEYRLAKSYTTRNDLNDESRCYYSGIKDGFGYLLYNLNSELLDKLNHKERSKSDSVNR